MCSLFWFLSVLVLTVQVKSDISDVKNAAISCHQCAGANKTYCEAAPSVLCPPDKPLCATVAESPTFESSLVCAAPSSSPCSLEYDGKLHLTCTCIGHLCNAPYTTQFKNELYNFSTIIPENTTVDMEMFLNSSIYVNVTKEKLYRIITVGEFRNSVNISSFAAVSVESIIGPRAEALKHEVTVSPDDEDDGEGSGTFEDKQPPSAPAAPSSFLPSEHNDSSNILVGFRFHIATLSLHIMFLLTYS